MKYDTTLKELFQSPPRRLLELLVGAQPVELLTVEYPAVRMRKPDLIARLSDGRIHHLELQSENDDDMNWRMLEYYAPIFKLTGLQPVQTVLYVGDKPLRMSAGIQHKNLLFTYEVKDIRTIDSGVLLDSDSLEDNLLALLCRMENATATIQEILRRIARLSGKNREDALTKLLILSGLRKLEIKIRQEVQKMPITVDVMRIPFVKEAFLEGEKKGEARGEKRGEARGEKRGEARGEKRGEARGEKRGEARGEKKGEAAFLRRLLERRFGELPDWAVKKIATANTTKLEKWSLQILDAKTLKEALR
ncbi:MAG: DUF4351 domain-containing protein [Acidobacteria bacterium]|nr:DUF4351 domain-containing protein [Acidobacteriota bacterium]